MQTKPVVFIIDMVSFYASVEKAQNVRYRDLPLVVAGDPSRRSGIVLAACPLAKQKGVKTTDRIGEALAKCPNLVVVQPRMAEYIKVSMQINEIFKTYSDMVEIFSIDESFIDVSASLHLFDYDVIKLAKSIQSHVKLTTGVQCRIGIGENKTLAKNALNNFAKSMESGIFILKKEELDQTLWPLPIDKLYMVGNRMASHFIRMGIYTIGDLAKVPLPDLKQRLRRRLGKNADISAQMYYQLAHGIDNSVVTTDTHEAMPKSIGNQITLPIDLDFNEVKVPLLELAEFVCLRSRRKGLMGSTVSVSCQSASFDVPSGFSKQIKLLDPTNITNHVYRAAVQLLERNWDRTLIRRVSLTLSSLVEDKGYQVTLFEDQERFKQLERTTDSLKNKYGDTIIMRAASLLPAGQARDRDGKIGGHYK